MNKEIVRKNGQKCVFLWALPRSVSTALTMCMSFVDGIQVWHEPYQYCYNNERMRDPKILGFGRDPRFREHIQMQSNKFSSIVESASKGSMINNSFFKYPWVKEQLETQDMDKDILFVKDMAFAIHNKYEFLPTSRAFRHTFLIRNPLHVYKSLRKLVCDITPDDYRRTLDLSKYPLLDAEDMYEHTYALWQYTKENLDPGAIIIDSSDLITQPEVLLPKYFEAIGISYRKEYQKWDPDADVTAQWKTSFECFTNANAGGAHTAATKSSCFMTDTEEPPCSDDLTPDVMKCVQSALPYYKEMYEQRVKP